MKTTERNREIRRILSGFFTYEMNGAVLTAAQNLLQLQPDGSMTGASKARMLGIREKLWQFRIKGNAEEIYVACQDAFFRLGRRAYLYSAPDVLVMIYRPLLRHSLLVTLEGTGKELLLGLYTARSLLSRLNLRLSYRRIIAELPDSLVETKVTMTPQSQKPEEPEKEGKRGKEGRREKQELPTKKKKRRS